MIVEVIVNQVEGLVHETGPVTFKGVNAEAAANLKLHQIALTAPDDGSYYKTDVTIVLDTGETLVMRHDVTKDADDCNIREHAMRVLKFIATETWGRYDADTKRNATLTMYALAAR